MSALPTMAELADEFAQLREILESEIDSPETIDQALDAWLASGELKAKIDGYAKMAKTFKADENSHDARAKIYEEEFVTPEKRKRDQAKRNYDKLTERLKVCMEHMGLTEIRGNEYKAAIQANGGVQSLDVSIPAESLPREYQAIEPNKPAIRADLETGKEIPGCKLLPRGTSVRFR